MNQKPISVKIIYWMTNILFWIYAAASLFAIFFAGGIILGLLNKTQLHVGLPVAMDLNEMGLMHYNGESVNVELVEMYGKLHFVDATSKVTRVFGYFMLVALSLGLYIFMTFKQFITNVYQGAYFDRGNILLLKRISYALIAMWLFAIFYAAFQKYYMLKHISFETVSVSGDYQTFNAVLVVALILWVLSHIFQKGVELQHDNELTI